MNLINYIFILICMTILFLYIINKTNSLGWRDGLQVAAVWIAENNDTNTEQYNVTDDYISLLCNIIS